MKSTIRAALFVFVLILAAGAVGALGAQEMANLPQGTQLAAQSLKPYWHVFIAYSIVILAVLGWVISMARRLARLEAQLSD
jgi:CcmD family protein